MNRGDVTGVLQRFPRSGAAVPGDSETEDGALKLSVCVFRAVHCCHSLASAAASWLIWAGESNKNRSDP